VFVKIGLIANLGVFKGFWSGAALSIFHFSHHAGAKKV
jgi:hypothetical protein